MPEWLWSGLQNHLREFNSLSPLQTLDNRAFMWYDELKMRGIYYEEYFK